MNFEQRTKLLKSFAVETNALRSYLSLQKTQWWSVDRLKQLQEGRMRSLLEHAYENVPYYRRLFRNRKLKPSDFSSVGDLAKLPIITKNDIRSHFNEFEATDSRSYWPISTATGGSTGDPLQFFIDARSAGIGAAVLWRGWGYAGYRLGDKMAVLAGLSLVSGKENMLRAAAKKVVRQMVGFPAINIRKETLDVYAKQMNRFKPKFIRGYPSSVYLFADSLKEAGFDEIQPRAVLTTAEMLFPYQRKLIEEVFGCDVFDGYGAFNGGTAAFECKAHSGYHVAVEKVVMEFVDEENRPVAEGEDGQIVATDLFNYAMPFIRYDTGDMGVYSGEECSCGRKLPLMKKILGRTTDILSFSGGAVLSGPSLTLVFKDFDIRQYQIVQISDDSMVVKIIKGRTYRKKDTDRIYRVLKNAVGNEVEVKLEFVDYIQPTRGGKWKFVVAHVKQNQEGG